MLEETARSSTFRHRPRAIILSECNLTSISRYCAKTSPWKHWKWRKGTGKGSCRNCSFHRVREREKDPEQGDRCPVNEVTSHGEQRWVNIYADKRNRTGLTKSELGQARGKIPRRSELKNNGSRFLHRPLVEEDVAQWELHGEKLFSSYTQAVNFPPCGIPVPSER